MFLLHKPNINSKSFNIKAALKNIFIYNTVVFCIKLLRQDKKFEFERLSNTTNMLDSNPDIQHIKYLKRNTYHHA